MEEDSNMSDNVDINNIDLIKLLLTYKHARLQMNMTCSARMKVQITVQVYTRKPIQSNKFKTGMDQFIQKEVQSEETRDVVNIGRIPVMVHFFAAIPFGDSGMVNLILSTIQDLDLDTDKKILPEGFRKEGAAFERMDELIRSLKFSPGECIKEIIEMYLFPTLDGPKQKAMFLAYMVKCLLLSYTGKRKCENIDDFRNKRLDLAGELIEGELRIHIKHAERRMVRAMQRDLYENRSLQQVEHYLDASINPNGLSRAFSTGHCSHPFNKSERISGVVGKLCFLSTPDGENCGLVKNITNMMDPSRDKLLECGMEKLEIDPSIASLKRKVKVFVNGDWVGVCDNSLSFVAKLRSKRQSKEVPAQMYLLTIMAVLIGSTVGMAMGVASPTEHQEIIFHAQTIPTGMEVNGMPTDPPPPPSGTASPPLGSHHIPLWQVMMITMILGGFLFVGCCFILRHYLRRMWQQYVTTRERRADLQTVPVVPATDMRIEEI